MKTVKELRDNMTDFEKYLGEHLDNSPGELLAAYYLGELGYRPVEAAARLHRDQRVISNQYSRIKAKWAPMTLMRITGQESGLVIYEGGDVIICNWSVGTGLPYVGPFGEIISAGGNLTAAESGRVENISDVVNPDNIIYDRNGDADNLNIGGTLYSVVSDDGTPVVVIAPDGWN